MHSYRVAIEQCFENCTERSMDTWLKECDNYETLSKSVVVCHKQESSAEILWDRDSVCHLKRTKDGLAQVSPAEAGLWRFWVYCLKNTTKLIASTETNISVSY